jgi:hypothetical protein
MSCWKKVLVKFISGDKSVIVIPVPSFLTTFHRKAYNLKVLETKIIYLWQLIILLIRVFCINTPFFNDAQLYLSLSLLPWFKELFWLYIIYVRKFLRPYKQNETVIDFRLTEKFLEILTWASDGVGKGALDFKNL